MNLSHDASYRNNPFVIVLDFDAKLGLRIFPYRINKYQLTTKYHNVTSQALTNAKASQDKQANLHCIQECLHKVVDKVLLSTKHINLKKVSLKIKSLRIGPFTILSAHSNRHNCSLDLTTDPSLNLMYNTFHVCKILPYIIHNSILFPQRQVEKPGPVSQDRYKVEKVMEYRKAPRSDILQYKVR